MKKYVYIVEHRELDNSGFITPAHCTDYFTSLKDAKNYIKNVIDVNKGFEVKNLEPEKVTFEPDVIDVISYLYNNHSGNCNQHQPQKNINLFLFVFKKRFYYH